MRFFRMPWGMAAAMSLLLAAPALAQEDGVFIDPDSPSGKEYAIPLEAERRLADPEQEPHAGIQQGSRSSPIFGTGIESDSESAEANSRAPSSKAGQERERERRRAATRKGEREDDLGHAEPEIRAAAANPGAPDGGAGVPLTIGGVAAGVLLVGGLIGLLLRRRA